MAVLECPRCQTRVKVDPGAYVACPTCGFHARAPGRPPTPKPVPVPTPPAPIVPAVPEPTAAAPRPPALDVDGAPTPLVDAPEAWQPDPGRTDGLAVASLVLGIVSVAGAFWVVAPPILAIIFGATALQRCNEDPTLRGRGMAIAGLVMGAVGAIMSVGALGTFWFIESWF